MSTYVVDADKLVKAAYNVEFPQTVDSQEFTSVIDWLVSVGFSKSIALDLFHTGAITVTYLD